MRLKGRTVRFFAALAAVCAFTAIASATAGSAAPEFTWLCKPGRTNDPCQGSLLTEKVNASGQSSKSTPKALNRLKNKIDCFYVYPTVSSQEGPNATLAEDPEIAGPGGIAAQQASRFTPGCRMFAPVYPQYTISAILGGGLTEEVVAKAYGGVKAAWNEYLKKFNKGRGIVLIGHSQGTGHLKQLIAETFDRNPNLRKRLVSAVLIGGNVIVPKGKKVGGNFKKVPACSRATQVGCVIAYSGFLKDPPPEGALFGRIGGALSEIQFSAEKYEILCVNPARLDGSKGRLKPLYNTVTFPGLYGALLPNLTAYESPWVSFPGLYSASCRKQGGSSWLSVQGISGESDTRPRIGEPLGRSWGTHLTEVNDAAGNLVSVVTAQEKTYLKKLAKAKKAKQKQKKKKQGGR